MLVAFELRSVVMSQLDMMFAEYPFFVLCSLLPILFLGYVRVAVRKLINNNNITERSCFLID